MCSVTNLNDHPKDAYVGSVFMCFSLLWWLSESTGRRENAVEGYFSESLNCKLPFKSRYGDVCLGMFCSCWVLSNKLFQQCNLLVLKVMVTSSLVHSAHFSCLSPVALASAASPLLHRLQLPLPVASASAASPLLRQLQLPLPSCVGFSCLSLICIGFSCCSPGCSCCSLIVFASATAPWLCPFVITHTWY